MATRQPGPSGLVTITHSLIPRWAASGFVGSGWLWAGDPARARAVAEGIWLGL